METTPYRDQLTKVIVRRPGQSLISGISTANLGIPDWQLAKQQHEEYIKNLEECGVEVLVLDEDDTHPDSVFVEDTAVLTDKVAIVTRPLPESRKGEIEEIGDILLDMFPNVEYIEEPGTLEGGDVLQIGDRFYIGISERTNKQGANQLIGILESFGYQGFKVSIRQLLHLKTGISFLGENTILVGKELLQEKRFNPYKKIKVDGAESYAANCLRINDFVLIPKGFPNTFQALQKAGFNLKEIDISEFRKLDGGLSCLS